MKKETPIRVPGWKDWGIAMTLFLVGVFATVAAGKLLPATRSGAAVTALVCATATFATTAWAVRFASYPRWAYWGSATVLSALAIAGALLVSDSRLWQEQLRSSLWMHSWYPVLFTTFAGYQGAGVCWAGTARGGWLMVGVAAFLGVIPAVAQLLFR